MNSRERFKTAMCGEKTDRFLFDFWMSKGFENKLKNEIGLTKEQFLDKHDVDFRFIDGPKYIGPDLKKENNVDEDIWGVMRRSVEVTLSGGTEIYKEVEISPLKSAATVEDVENYSHWPSAKWFDYSGIEEQCDKIIAKDKVVVFMGDRMNRIAQLKPATYIRGMEEILIDMCINPEIAKAIFKKIREFYKEYAEKIYKSSNGKLDVVLTGDDFGAQNAPLLSPEMWVEFLGGGFADYVAAAKKYGLTVMHHSCGSIKPIIPLLIDRGLDILQSVQPEANDMNIEILQKEFGDKLAFQGGISIQKTLPFGSPKEIEKEVKSRKKTFANNNKYILCTSHNVQADVSIKSAEVLLNAYKGESVDK